MTSAMDTIDDSVIRKFRTTAADGKTCDVVAPPVPLDIDPGIRNAVILLQSAGIETFESCEGGDGHAYPEPTVRFHGGTWAGYRAFAVAMEGGLPVTALRYTYATYNGHLGPPCWEMVFDVAVRDADAGDRPAGEPVIRKFRTTATDGKT